MSRRLKLVGLGLIAVLLVLQFFQPESNNTPVDPEQDMLEVLVPRNLWRI